MLSVVGEKSFGLMSIVPKTKDGKAITDFEKNIIYDTENGNKTELKEWYAVVQYLQSFEQEDGVSQIPDYYQETHGRKVIDHSRNIIKLVKNPNRISLTVYIAVPIIIGLLILLIVKLVRRIRRKKVSRK
jgi:hypothetical protein